jgi:hypothetical protein
MLWKLVRRLRARQILKAQMGTHEREKTSGGKTTWSAWWVHSQRVWDVLKALSKGGGWTNPYIGYLLDDCNLDSQKPVYGSFCPNLPKVVKSSNKNSSHGCKLHATHLTHISLFTPSPQQHAMCALETLQLSEWCWKLVVLCKLKLLLDTRHGSKYQPTTILHIIVIDADLKGS